MSKKFRSAKFLMKQHEVAAAFHEMANLLEFRGENPFRIRAYRKAAQNLETLTEEVESLPIVEGRWRHDAAEAYHPDGQDPPAQSARPSFPAPDGRGGGHLEPWCHGLSEYGAPPARLRHRVHPFGLHTRSSDDHDSLEHRDAQSLRRHDRASHRAAARTAGTVCGRSRCGLRCRPPDAHGAGDQRVSETSRLRQPFGPTGQRAWGPPRHLHGYA
ncbi:MAG: hypothetical protein HYZ89_00565 [Candidatus Omnitrophica bacterium]|nr:hypothetical protein [Candidatus Omnitrophota bacterium]